MRRQNLFRILFGGLVWSTIACRADAAPPNAPSPAEAALDHLVVVSNAICMSPGDFGFSVGGEATADAKGKLPRLMKIFVDAGLSATVNAKAEVHKGIAQKDFGKAFSDRNGCAERVFLHLVDRYDFSDLQSGARVKRPANAGAAYRVHSKSVSSKGANGNPASVTVTGSGLFNGVNQGTVNINASNVPTETKKATTKLVAECQFGLLVDKVPPSGTYYRLDLFPNSRDYIAEGFGSPGAPIKWNDKGPPAVAYHCNIINFGDETLLNVAFSMDANYWNTSKNGNTTKKSLLTLMEKYWG